MKIFIVPLLLALVIFFAGIFIVDQREVAVVTNYNKQQFIYDPGVHWAIPGLSSVDYVYTNTQTSLFTISESMQTHDNKMVSVGVLVNWQINEPKLYLSNLNKIQQIGVDEHLTKILTNIIESQVNNSSLFELNQNYTLFESVIKVPELGITLKNTVIENIALLNSNSQTDIVESRTNMAAFSNESSVIESAYRQSQKMKADLLVEKARLYQPVIAKNAKFYDYWSKLDIYKSMAKTNLDMPPLKDLYKSELNNKNK